MNILVKKMGMLFTLVSIFGCSSLPGIVEGDSSSPHYSDTGSEDSGLSDTDSQENNDSESEENDSDTCNDSTYTTCEGGAVVEYDLCDSLMATVVECDTEIQFCDPISSTEAACACLSPNAVLPTCETCLGNRDPAHGCERCLPGLTGEDCNECVRYVNIDSWAVTPDGLTWETAFRDPQDGIDAAHEAARDATFGYCGVWVAKGEYRLWETSGHNGLIMKEGVSLLGGFAGTEVLFDEQDHIANETVFSGAYTIAEEPHKLSRLIAGSDDSTIGWLTLSHCHSTEYSGAVTNSIGASALYQVTFRDNHGIAVLHQGPLSMSQFAVPMIQRCRFEHNTGRTIVVHDAQVHVSLCVFWSNVNDSTDPAEQCLVHVTGGAENISFWNNTFVSNEITDAADSAIICSNQPVNATNNIFWQPDLGTQSILVYADEEDPKGLITYNKLSHSFFVDRWRYFTFATPDPGFVDHMNGNLRLTAWSMYIDAGDPAYSHIPDKDSNSRVDIPGVNNTQTGEQSIVDMGAYEYIPN